MSIVKDTLSDAAKGAVTFVVVSQIKGEAVSAVGMALDASVGAGVGVACKWVPKAAGAVRRTYANLEYEPPGYPRPMLQYIA